MKEHVIGMLNVARDTLNGNPILGDNTGQVNAKGEMSIGMDIKVEEALIEYLKRNNLPVTVFSEEAGTIKLNNNPEYLVAFDPLDGSTNYKLGKGMLPFGTLVAFYKGTSPKLGDVVAAGAMEQTSGKAWIYDGQKTTTTDGSPVDLQSDWTIDKSTPVYFDLYYKEGYELYRPLPEKIFVRNTGSTIGNLNYVLSGVAAGMGGVCVRAEEIGAIYALIKGAGGMVCNYEGEGLGEELFSADKTYPILAGYPKAITEIVNLLKNR